MTHLTRRGRANAAQLERLQLFLESLPAMPDLQKTLHCEELLALDSRQCLFLSMQDGDVVSNLSDNLFDEETLKNLENRYFTVLSRHKSERSFTSMTSSRMKQPPFLIVKSAYAG